MRKNRADDYLKTIYQICEHSRQAVATTGVIARRSGVSAGTVSTILKQLAEAGLLVYRPYEGAQLTQEGLRRALATVRRQRLLELFLSRTLGVPWDQVAAEAARLESSASDELIGRIDAHLGNPAFDPHGDPIPRPDGTLPAASRIALAGCTPGTAFVVARVLDQSPGTLRYLAEIGLEIGLRGEVLENSTASGIIAVLTARGTTTLSHAVAAKIIVSVESAG